MYSTCFCVYFISKQNATYSTLEQKNPQTQRMLKYYTHIVPYAKVTFGHFLIYEMEMQQIKYWLGCHFMVEHLL